MKEAAERYTGLGWIVHPLSRPDKEEKNAGKRPIESGWQKRENTRTEAEIKKYWGRKDPYNLGLQCGERSGVTVIDVDDWNPAIWQDMTADLDTEGWLISHRTKERGHIYFKYVPDLKACKHHDLGIEILSDGNNAVLPPSRHKSGQVYQFNREPETLGDLPEMPELLKDRLKALFAVNDQLNVILAKCKPCLSDVFTRHTIEDKKNPSPLYHNVETWHGSTGRQLTLAVMADLKANGATRDVMYLAAKYMFRHHYTREKTEEELGHMGGKIGKPWKCDTIKRELSQYTLDENLKSKCDDCTFRQAPKKTKVTPEPRQEDDPYGVDLDELDQPEEVIKAAEEEARRILAEGDPIKYILDTIREKHTGDENTQEGTAISIAGQSCLNTAGLQISVNGESGSGKSHGMKTHLHLVPSRYKRETSLSAKAAYYMDLKPGLILFSDDKDPDENMEDAIKRATTNYQQYTTHTTVKDQKAQIVTIPPRINWLLTSVESHVSDQLLNRQLTFSTDSGPDQKRDIFEMQKAEALAGELFMLEVTQEVLTCRRIYEGIKAELFNVKIPFADRIEIKDKSNSRLFPMFADMIKGYAIFKFQQRQRDPDGYILAELEDFNRAKRLFESQRESLVSKLNERERKIIQYIAQHPEGSNLNEIAKGTGFTYAVVNRALMGRKDRENGGLLDKCPGLTMTDQTTSAEEREGVRVGRKEKVFRIENLNTWALFDSEFIELKAE